MKKILFAALFIVAGLIGTGQNPTTIKPASDQAKLEVINKKAKLDKMKIEMKELLAQYNKQLNAAQATMSKIESIRKDLTNTMKDLESQDKLGNFEIQDLMSQYNQSETMAGNVLKKVSDSKNAVVKKIN